MRIRLLTLIFVFIILLMMGVGYRCYVLQGPGNNITRESVKGHRTRIADKPIRGMILDRYGAALAITNTVYNVFADPRTIGRNNKKVANILAPIINIDAHEISKMITKSSNQGYSVIKREISEEEKFHIKQAGLGGVGIEAGVPVAGVVLGAGEDALLLHALDEGESEPDDQVRIVGEGPRPDDRVVEPG